MDSPPQSHVRGNDDALLASLGYKQELKRDFSAIQIFGISFSIIGVLPSVASVLVYAIPNGGASAMVWGWATCSIFLVFIAMAMAELGSAAPTAGGLYFWTFTYSPPRYRRLLSWLVGYTNTIGYIAGTAGVDWGLAVQIMALASIGSDLSFTPTVSQTFGVYCALLFCHAIISSMATKIVARLQNIYIALNILLPLAVIVALPIATPTEFKNSAGYAFGDFQNTSGWPDGFAFILSFLAPLWTIGGFDSSLHLSEEANNASFAVPFAVMSATTLGCLLGWGIVVALAFNMGSDLSSIVDNPVGQPFVTIFLNSFGKTGTIAIWSFIIIAQFMMGSSSLTASSRQTWAFARDGALPFSSYLYRINPYTGTPVHCVWFSAFCAFLLCLLAFAGTAAIGAVFTLGVVSQYIAYSIPITARVLYGKQFKPGRFNLGAYSRPVAIIAVVWMTFAWIVLLFPTAPAPTTTTMNYAVAVMGGTLVLATIYYFFPKYGGVHWFEGPLANIHASSLGQTVSGKV
ncbi:hypothetical protein SERLA73DRAFT_127192 [Serpula lacrymans var. lacrymans S7.3]|uniref:Amino acid transporter n=2 Tax=Serpula lacrymans var. lacrymans TaxID=341189 RepID=F8QFT9_SERL3|nr:uncharacterized protein SERLADRAFT_375137 [Serpula lacrymans var. lacrymans S7.9]EGN92829.1 hypothetical protein SERLA73DRAFT_127192 [Serpula lacrymans var. lacrymans S7.3]EGO18504.1 hypothetical protein SERLADRAFT_375137 [Serpula lacrymans var. lacrymans S7.9]